MGAESKVALVTGASRGIGASIAMRLADKGFIVIGTATTEMGAAVIDGFLAQKNGSGEILDVTDFKGIEHLLRKVKNEYGDPLVLVNNAGITQDNILLRMKDAEWDQVIETNLSALFRLTKAILRGMTRARWGRVINITSVVGSMGNAGQSNYAAAKAGAEGMSRSLAKELGSRSITINCVSPGFINTDMTRELKEEHRLALHQQIPLGRLGEPEDVAAVVEFLVSDGAGYITGETINVNGGLYMG